MRLCPAAPRRDLVEHRLEDRARRLRRLCPAERHLACVLFELLLARVRSAVVRKIPQSSAGPQGAELLSDRAGGRQVRLLLSHCCSPTVALHCQLQLLEQIAQAFCEATPGFARQLWAASFSLCK